MDNALSFRCYKPPHLPVAARPIPPASSCIISHLYSVSQFSQHLGRTTGSCWGIMYTWSGQRDYSLKEIQVHILSTSWGFFQSLQAGIVLAQGIVHLSLVFLFFFSLSASIQDSDEHIPAGASFCWVMVHCKLSLIIFVCFFSLFCSHIPIFICT